MKYFNKQFIFMFSVMAMCYTCTDLDEVLEDELTTNEFGDPGVPDNSAATEGGVFPSAELSSSYARLRNGSAGHGSYYSIQTVSSDEMAIGQKGGDWFDGGIWLDMHRHTFNSSNGPINGTWIDAYGGINEVNNALASGLDAELTAQAKTIRAFFYYRLVDLFGRVKIITTPGVDAPQASRTEVFNFVEQELLDALGIPAVTAVMDLSSSPLGTAQEPYIVNQFAAMGLLAKLYLNAEVYTGTPRYQEAAWAAGYVIDNGPYQLCDSGCMVTNLAKRPEVDADPEMLEGYAAVFAPNNQFNPEMVWSIYYDETNATGMNFSQMNMHYSSQQTFALDQQPWNGYQVLEEFYNSYDDADLRKEANFLAGPQLDFSGSALLDFAADDEDLQVNYTPRINELAPNSQRESGTRAKKFSFQLFGRQEMNNDYPIIRLGDMYLVRGEAMARAAGNWNMSLTDVNTIRARAGLAALGSITADEFFDERGREMFQEVDRRQTRIRFGKWGESWWEKTNSDSFRTVFPIPQEQIEASGGTLTQNTGY